MRLLIPLFIIGFIVLEINVIAMVGDAIGGWTTFFSIIASAVVGIAIVRHEGIKTLFNMQNKMAHGETPTAHLVDGLLLLLAGVLLLLPGFISDTIGLLLALPLSRVPLRFILMQSFMALVLAKAGQAAGSRAGRSGEDVVEGEFKRDDDPKQGPPSLS
uniref:FxsA cytoplasmic membrane protein n=1 Tax=Magnetococcus massalia (strain MO-1) TaxID=451514 RepID=A0A1S7LP11_MAGMO|nr:FxsA cytoplasmic membrane protein [Candidatus Magnetococcus massalia]